MIFRQVTQVLDGTKTQTRRPVRENEWLTDWYGVADTVMERVTYGKARIKWQVGRTYAVQPGRGKKAVGRIRITKIRRERLQNISEEDCKAEGIDRNLLYEMDYIPGHQSWGDDRYFSDEQRVVHPRGSFALLWDKIYPKQYNWLENPEVWALDFERSEG